MQIYFVTRTCGCTMPHVTWLKRVAAVRRILSEANDLFISNTLIPSASWNATTYITIQTYQIRLSHPAALTTASTHRIARARKSTLAFHTSVSHHGACLWNDPFLVNSCTWRKRPRGMTSLKECLRRSDPSQQQIKASFDSAPKTITWHGRNFNRKELLSCIKSYFRQLINFYHGRVRN